MEVILSMEAILPSFIYLCYECLLIYLINSSSGWLKDSCALIDPPFGQLKVELLNHHKCNSPHLLVLAAWVAVFGKRLLLLAEHGLCDNLPFLDVRSHNRPKFLDKGVLKERFYRVLVVWVECLLIHCHSFFPKGQIDSGWFYLVLIVRCRAKRRVQHDYNCTNIF